MRSRGLSVALVVFLLACAVILGLRRPATMQNDLLVTFIGLTNNPGKSIFPTLSVLSDGFGLHALFAVTNIGPEAALQFGILAVETQRGTGSSLVFPTGFRRSAVELKDRNGWRATEAGGFFTAPMAMQWRPRHGCVYAVRWPTALGLDTPWRLRLWVRREPNIYLGFINQRLRRELFRPHGDHTVTSSIVGPFTLLSNEPKPVDPPADIRAKRNDWH